MKTKCKYITLAAVIALLHWSCVRDDNEIRSENDDYTRIAMDVLVPGSGYGAKSRALTGAGENHVEELTVLVFDAGGAFRYRADAQTVESTVEDNVKRFTVNLKTGQCDIWILANCKDIIEAYTIPGNATKASLRQNLLLELNAKWNTTYAGFVPLPMWGERTGLNVTPDLSLTGTGNRIPLIRAVAKVEVTIDRTTVPAADFTMEGMRFYHWSNRGQLVPDEAVLSSDKTKVTAISGNTGTTAAAERQTYGPSERDGDGFFTNLIYLPETPAGTAGTITGNPCLIIYATYKGTAGWYKIELLDDQDNCLPLLRNYRYTFEIVKVGGRGYATPDEAYKSKALNLTVRVHTHSDATLTNVMYDGQYWLAWDPDKFEMDKEAHGPTDDGHNLLQIETNCEDGWKLQRIEYPSGGQTGWLSIPTTEQSGAKNTRGQVHFVASVNNGTSRTAIVHFSAGRMDMSVEVTQSDESNMEILILDADDSPLGDIFWVNTVEKKIQERLLRVKWTPAEANMSVTVHPGTANDYPVFYESGGDIPAGPVDGEGLHEYHLKFSQLNKDEALANLNNYFVEQPFRTRYTFTLDYHGKQVQKNLIIAHHLHIFHLMEYDSDGYLMGLGHRDKRLWFGSSAPFDAELSNDYDILTLNGDYSQPGPAFNPDGNLGPGEYHNQNFQWFVRFKNPTPERRNQYESVKIRFRDSELPDTTIILKPLAFLPNCYIVAPGSSVQVPVRNPWDARWNSRHPSNTMPILPPLPTTGDFTCELLWEDDDGLIRNIKFTPADTFDPYRTEITVETNSGHGEGNAVIALRRDGTIIWSWHIWVTDYDPDNSPVYAYNKDDPYPMYFMDRNLGAIANNNNGAANRFNSIGMYYQGGRKDPFPPANYIPAQGATVPLSDHLIVYPDNTIIKTAIYEPGTPEQTLRRTIENPTTFIITPQAPYDWLAGNLQRRWEPYQRPNGTETTSYKSVYDPCPEGWVVPQPLSKVPFRGYPWSAPGKLGDFYPTGNMSLLRDNFGIFTSNGDFYPAAGFISHVDGNYTEIGLSMRLPVTTTYSEPSPEFTGLGTFIYRATNSEFAGYVNSTHAQGMNIRCARIDYYKPEND